MRKCKYRGKAPETRIKPPDESKIKTKTRSTKGGKTWLQPTNEEKTRMT